MKKVLILGGAGFVGSHTADALLREGYDVTVFDNLSEQVHGARFPAYLSSDVHFIKGDVRDLSALSRAVANADAIYHLAAAVGVGQSMYDISTYMSVNVQGTANVLQAILDMRAEPEKLIVASSMSIYGEGRCLCEDCGEVAPHPRNIAQFKRKQWELSCPFCGKALSSISTSEGKPLECTSIYALCKKAQEEMALLFGRTYDIPTVALRYFNIYAPRQALSNPYTGVAAIFASRLMNDSAPLVFEDGLQLRDFVEIRDIVQANLLALTSSGADGMAVNVGSGKPVTVRQVAEEISRMLGTEIQPTISGTYRVGDIRHCYADISTISRVLGYAPQVSFREGIATLVEWLQSQQAHDYTEQALTQLTMRGLVA